MPFLRSFVNVLLSFLICFFAMHQAKAQNHDAERLHANALGKVAESASKPGSVHILYTGKLFGYFRSPDSQPPDDSTHCPDGRDQRPSLAARQFTTLIGSPELQDSILIGMGDNFSPEIEARKFCQAPDNQYKTDKSLFNRSGKEYFVWDGSTWRTNEYVSGPKGADLDKRLQNGYGFVAKDNVAGFFVEQGYAAVVPGKHDFYYGAERLRELALLLASSEIHNPATIHMHGVQMLGSNLVIETTGSPATNRCRITNSLRGSFRGFPLRAISLDVPKPKSSSRESVTGAPFIRGFKGRTFP
jgi:hypothetical protein